MSERGKNDLQQALFKTLNLIPLIQTGIRDGFISMGSRAIINIEDLDAQTGIYQKIVSQNLSTRYRSLVKNYQSLNPKNTVSPKSSRN
jgi:ParB family chromosome partitioning protein